MAAFFIADQNVDAPSGMYAEEEVVDEEEGKGEGAEPSLEDLAGGAPPETSE